MIQFTTTIQRAGEMGEMSGWTYILIPAAEAQKLMPGNKKSFRVKGKLDNYVIKQVALMPWGDGSFYLALNADMRKGTGKTQGAQIKVMLEVDTSSIEVPSELQECLDDDVETRARWDALPLSHRNYFIKHVSSAKGIETRARRVAMVMRAVQTGQDFGAMLREERDTRRALGR